MQVKMIFGTIVELGGQVSEFRCDTVHDLPAGLAHELIAKGRAESLEAPAPAKKAKA